MSDTSWVSDRPLASLGPQSTVWLASHPLLRCRFSLGGVVSVNTCLEVGVSHAAALSAFSPSGPKGGSATASVFSLFPAFPSLRFRHLPVLFWPLTLKSSELLPQEGSRLPYPPPLPFAIRGLTRSTQSTPPSHVSHKDPVHASGARSVRLLPGRGVTLCCVRGHWVLLCMG